ncbi:MAG: peptidoglycan binding domain-containing protein [Blautia sp.]|nr:peptidoglycan binding domain-containing protein [Blautia sp.]
MKSSSKILLTIILLLIAFAGGAYGYGAYFFSRHFFPGSTVNGYNCSYMTVQETEALMNREVQAYKLAVETQGDGREVIAASQVELTYASDGSVERMIREQDIPLWFLEFEQERSYDLSRSMKLNESHLQAVVDDLKCMNPSELVQPEDAVIVETDAGFEIRPEVPGNILDRDRVTACIGQAMLSGRVRVSLEDEGCYYRPQVTSENELLVRNLEQMNRMGQVIITLDFGRQTERLDRSTIKNWFIPDENGDVVLDKEKVRAYVKEVAAMYDTRGTVRDFVTYDGRTIQVSGGDFGWVIDVKKETAELMECIESGQIQVREPVYKDRGVSRSGLNDIGYTYVEIDITTQKLVYYENGQPLIETPCVTGNMMQAGTGTPTGVWKAGASEAPKWISDGFSLTAPIVDAFTSDSAVVFEEPAVITDDGQVEVSYWMPFYHFGITEGVNRSEYGGDKYIFEGTTGNVEIPPDQAASLYGKFSEGLPVVIY